MATSVKEYVERVYKGKVSCEGLSRLHEMESELNGWISRLDAGIVESMEADELCEI